MPQAPEPTLDEITAFAERYGLTRLHADHLQRMRELAVYVADLGRNLPRVPSKDDKPAPFAAR